MHCRNIEGTIAKYKATVESESDPFNIINKSNEGLKLNPRVEQIISLMISNPASKVDDIAKTIGTSKTTIEREILVLKKNGIVNRDGARKSGKWIIKIGKMGNGAKNS